MSDEEDDNEGGKKVEALPPHKIRMTDMQDAMCEKIIRCKYKFMKT